MGNCWFVCALSALAETPADVRRVLVTKEHNHAGVYQVTPLTPMLTRALTLALQPQPSDPDPGPRPTTTTPACARCGCAARACGTAW